MESTVLTTTPFNYARAVPDQTHMKVYAKIMLLFQSTDLILHKVHTELNYI